MSERAFKIAYLSATLAQNPHFKADIEREAVHDVSRKDRMDKRLSLLTAKMPGNIGERVVSRSYRKLGHNVVGLGWHSIVLREDDCVRKIYHRTRHMDNDTQIAYRDDLTERHAMLSEYYEDVTLPQNFFIDMFPLSSNQTCVSALQSFTDNEPVDMQKRVTRNTRQFLERVDRTYQSTGVMPDIVGLGNIVTTPNGHPLIIDTIPLLESESSDTAALMHAKNILSMHVSKNKKLSIKDSF